MFPQSCICIVCFSVIALLIMVVSQAVGKHFSPPDDNADLRTVGNKLFNNSTNSASMFIDEAYVLPANTSDVKLNLTEQMKYQYMLETNEVSVEQMQPSPMNKCQTQKLTYGCCYKFPEVTFLICVNITYLPHDYGLNFTLRIGDAVYSEEVSLRNPPPICLDSDYLIPYKIGKLCVRIHDIDVTSTHVHFCAKLFFEILIKSIYTKELGCVEIPVNEVVLQV